MSRIGKLPITLPKGVEVKIDGHKVTVKGPNGELSDEFNSALTIKMEDGKLIVERPDDTAFMRAIHGTTRALLNNMVTGCSQGFEKTMEINGVGYRAEMKGNDLVLNVGYSHPVLFPAPEGISYEVETKTRQVKIKGRDRHQVGQVAVNMREVRVPDHYKGYGIRYLGEVIKLKAGKAGKTGK